MLQRIPTNMVMKSEYPTRSKSEFQVIKSYLVLKPLEIAVLNGRLLILEARVSP